MKARSQNVSTVLLAAQDKLEIFENFRVFGCTVQEGASTRELGWVDSFFGSSTVSHILLGQVRMRQYRHISWARW